MYTSKDDIIERLSNLPQDKLVELLRIYEAEQSKLKLAEANKDGLVFDICSIPPEVQNEVSLYDKCKDSQLAAHNKKWVETIKALPTKTTYLPKLDKDYLEYAHEVWKEQVSGLEEIYDKLLLHIVQYLRTGRTRPIIMAGAPGCGKTRVMLTLGEILEMPVHFANAVQMAKGNGLTGSSKTYISACPGEPIEAMVRHKRGNLIFAIDEIDKAMHYAGHGGDFQDELLNLTSDETAKYHKDNFIGFPVDTSHLFIIMTANDLDSISEPLKSRCDVINFPEPTQEMITDIMTKHTVPKLLDTLKCHEYVIVNSTAISDMVSLLFKSGIRDVRKFQNIVEGVINSAFLESLGTDACVEVTSDTFLCAIEKTPHQEQRRIGFY